MVLTSTFSFETITVNDKGQEIARCPRQVESWIEHLGNGIDLDLVVIPGGTYQMGSPIPRESEIPQHLVTVQSFCLSQYPITQAQWQAVATCPVVRHSLDPDPSFFKGDKHPVHRVSWYQAVEFCERLSHQTGREYRLPTEAEWEYACRAGTVTSFHFGETMTTDLANYNGTDHEVFDDSGSFAAEPKGIYRGQTTEVGSFLPNSFGLYDMHGNVWEWCLDHWHRNYESAPNDGSAWLANERKIFMVLRGGSWIQHPDDCRSARRIRCLPDGMSNDTGFRVVCSSLLLS